jgi:lipoate-protein ligase A
MWIDDQIFEEAEQDISLKIWEPNRPLIVLGRSNDAAIECNIKQCSVDQVEILKRAGGGGTVVLFPGCSVISCGIWVDRPYHNDHYFRLINQAVINCIAEIDPIFNTLEQSGISDISYRDRKCAGTSMFRSRNYLLYQASILVRTELTLINKYLAHPSREPEYRKGRAHGDFLICLSDIVHSLSAQGLNSALQSNFVKHLKAALGSEMITSPRDQADYIKKKSQTDVDLT